VDIVVEVDAPDPALDKVIVSAEEPVVPVAAESRERLVAAAPVAAEAAADLAPPVEATPTKLESLPAGEIEAAEVPVEVPVEEEEDEQAPVSSRRPVAAEPEERLAQMAFGHDEPAPAPLHTPPPESGRLPAAPVVDDYDGDTTGVREAQPVVLQAAAVPPPVHALVPDETRPTIGPSRDVADVVGDAQRFAPSTFVELLDATLAL
jgi:hypothetical protein